jgi:hypothetical protein
MMNLEEFNIAVKACNRITYRVYRTVLLAGLVYILAFLQYYSSILAYVAGLRYGAWVPTSLVFLVVCFPAVLAIMSGSRIRDRYAKRDPRLQCPHCKVSLARFQYLVTCSRNCPNCGKRVADDPA